MCKKFNTSGTFHIYVDGSNTPSSDVIYSLGSCPTSSCNVLAYYSFDNTSNLVTNPPGSINIGPDSKYAVQPLYTGTSFGFLNSTVTLQTASFPLYSDGAYISFWTRTDDNQYSGEDATVYLNGTKSSILLVNLTGSAICRVWQKYQFGLSNDTIQAVGSSAFLSFNYRAGKIIALDEIIVVAGYKDCFAGNCYLFI